jgi:hypothetical protein
MGAVTRAEPTGEATHVTVPCGGEAATTEQQEDAPIRGGFRAPR